MPSDDSFKNFAHIIGESVSATTAEMVTAPAKVKAFIKTLEKKEGRELNYSVLPYDEFYYRLSIRDKFITELLSGKYVLLRDEEQILKS